MHTLQRNSLGEIRFIQLDPFAKSVSRGLSDVGRLAVLYKYVINDHKIILQY